MRIRKVDNAIEKQIVTAMIVSDKFLKDVRSIYADDLMAIPFARTTARWCLDYFETYGKAPGIHIQDLFDSHRRNGLDGEQAPLIEEFLADISDEYERSETINAQYLLDRAEERFDSRNQELLMADVRALHAESKYKEADELIRTYKRVELPSTHGIEPLTDEAAIDEAFDDSGKDILFELPGELGRLIGSIEREDFVGILGPEKRGKTWRLLDIAMRGLRARCNVAYFDAGDMGQKKITKRLHIRNSGMSDKYYGKQKSPVLDCAYSQDDSCTKRERVSKMGVMREVRKKGQLMLERKQLEEEPDYRPCTICQKDAPRDFVGAVWHEWINVERLTATKAKEIGKRTTDRSRKRLRISCHSNSTLTVREMDATLNRWRDEDGFIPDIVIADYFDIFAPENPKVTEERQKQNDTWKAGRRLSQEWHVALFTATQADAASFDQKILREKNFSEDKRKYGHVTKFMTLNQTPEEKRDGVMRIGTMFVREDDFDIERTVTVLQNLRIGQPYMGSF